MNYSFSAIASALDDGAASDEDDMMLHQILRDNAAAELIKIDTTGTLEMKARLIDMIAGVLIGGMSEFEIRFGKSIGNYARRYTALNKKFAGAPEAMVMAHYLQRTIAIITPPTDTERRRQLAMGNPNPPDMIFVYLPDFSMRVQKYIRKI